MKTNAIRNATVMIILIVGGPSGHAQGTLQFVNLNFESPILPLDPNDPNGVPVINALPGWTAFIGGSQVDRIFYDTVSLGGAAISLHDPMSHFYQPLQGNYNVLLQGSGAD